MRDVDQATVLRVLRDKAEADGGLSPEVRRWVADSLASMRIAGSWELSTGREGSVGSNPRDRCWRRAHLGQPIGCVASVSTGGGARGTGERNG